MSSSTKPGAWLSLEVDCLMLKIWSDHNARVVLADGSDAMVLTVAFHPDRMHVIDGTDDGIRRWRVADGQVIGRKQTGVGVNAVSVSKDYKWVVCGTREGASVWDAEIQEEAVKVEGGEDVYAVDVAPDCTKFATGTSEGKPNIWSITTGERLVGPLELGGLVSGIRFSPDGERIVAARDNFEASIHIFNSRNGDQLISIENPMDTMSPLTPIAWSMDGERLFATSKDSKIKSFDASTGSQLAEWKIHDNNDSERMCIAVAANNTFIACSAGRFVSFWDTSTHTQIGIVEDSDNIKSIALSPDGSHLASGCRDLGRINIWDLSSVLSESYLSTNVSTGFFSTRMPIIHQYLFLHPCNVLVRPDPDRKWSSVSVTHSSVAYHSYCCLQAQNVSSEKAQELSFILIYVQAADGSRSNPAKQVAASQDDDNALLEVRMSAAPPWGHCADGGHRPNCHRLHRLLCSITMR